VASLKRVYLAAAVGFCVPTFCGVAGFIFLNARESVWTDIFWYAVYVTCPSWLSPERSASWILTPVLNGLTYGFVAWLQLLAFRYRSNNRVWTPPARGRENQR